MLHICKLTFASRRLYRPESRLRRIPAQDYLDVGDRIFMLGFMSRMFKDGNVGDKNDQNYHLHPKISNCHEHFKLFTNCFQQSSPTSM